MEAAIRGEINRCFWEGRRGWHWVTLIQIEGLSAVGAGNGSEPLASASVHDELDSTFDVLDTRTIEILKLRRAFRTSSRRRGWLVRRMLLAAVFVGLAIAFFVSQQLFEPATVAIGFTRSRST